MNPNSSKQLSPAATSTENDKEEKTKTAINEPNENNNNNFYEEQGESSGNLNETLALAVEEKVVGEHEGQEKETKGKKIEDIGKSNETEDGENVSSSSGIGPSIRLPDNLESLMRADNFPSQRHRWNTNEEIAAILISFSRHPEWLSKEVKIRPKSGSVLLYSRKKVRYRRDGYCWKKRKDGKTTREDHMKLKVQGTECIYGCYVHSAILPTFHRRCYWLLQNPDIVLVHYLNVPYPDDNKLIITSNVALWGEKKEWTKEELISQLKPMFFSEEEPDLNNKIQVSTAETVEAIVVQLLEKQRLARQSQMLESTSTSTAAITTPTTSSPAQIQQSTNNNNNQILNNQNSNNNNHMNSVLSDILNNQKQQQQQSIAPRLVPSTLPAISSSSSTVAPVLTVTTVQIPSTTTTTSASNPSTFKQQQPAVNLSSGGTPTVESSRPFVLNLSQFQSAGGLIILNGKQGAPVSISTTAPTTTNQRHATTTTTNIPTHSIAQVAMPEIHHHELSQTSQQFVHPANCHPQQQRTSHQLQRVSSDPSPLLSHSNHSTYPTGGHATATVHHHSTPGNYFVQEETLEMSHEDIQRTLSANMSQMNSAGLEPMSPSGDDVFINLDAFDILADLSAEDLDSHHQNHCNEKNNTIVDINPEWAYSEGGTKILIVGQFNNADWDYVVYFGDFPVPAVFVQNGVLKCFCPSHSPGLVPIRVFSNGKQISTNSMVFEYKIESKGNVIVPVPPTETSLKLCLIHRMESVETCFSNFKSDLFGVKSLEDCVVKLCCEMMTQEWISPQNVPSPDRGLTLLHLSAALGFTRLLFTLIQWKRENPAQLLDSEVNPNSIDEFGLTPLMWATRNGHVECAIILAQWNLESLTKRDSKGRSPIQLAISRGHSKLATELEKIQHTTNRNSSHSTGSDTNHNFGGLDRFQRSVEDFGFKDCFFGQPDSSLALALPSEEESRVLTLAEQIIAAMPERIKKESCEEMSPGESLDSSSMISSDPSEQNDISFDFSDRNYRYYDSGTPSSLSPSSSCLQSPCSSSFTVDSPQPTTADFCEFLQASAFEKDFSNLTLSDREQRELYEAAKVIQKAYRSYKGRKKLEEEEKEKVAAVIIQNYYRRYKQYAYLRQVTDAALVIQNQFRSYCENKRFKRSTIPRETINAFRQPTNSQILRTLSQRKQNQAAKKIQQFMRQSKNKLQRERAERENPV